jgi:hypothetical protein
MLMSEAPRGYRRAPSKLVFVPESLERQREVWTWDEWKLIDRCAKLLKSRSINMTLSCGHESCDGKIEQIAGTNNPTLQCDCRTRVFERTL